MKRTSVLLAALMFTLSACGVDAGDAQDSATHPSAESTERTAASTGTVRTATCTDPAGGSGTADLVGVDLAEGDAGLKAAFTLAKPLDVSTGTRLLSLSVSSDDGNTARQLGAKWIDGQVGVFVFDFESGNKTVNTSPVVTGSRMEVTFPSSAVAGLGNTWRWGAATSVDGVDVDGCPEPGDDPMNAQRQRFPA